MGHFFSLNSSGHLRSDAYQSQIIGRDISPHPPPPGFRHPCLKKFDQFLEEGLKATRSQNKTIDIYWLPQQFLLKRGCLVSRPRIVKLGNGFDKQLVLS